MQLTDNDYDDGSPVIDGDHVVWPGHVTKDSRHCQVFFYDGRTITQLTPSEERNGAPGISGPRIAYIHDDGNDREICLAIREGAESDFEASRARAVSQERR